MTKSKYQRMSNGEIYHSTHIFSEAKILPEKEGKHLHQSQANESLQKMLGHGQTVYTALKHVSTSGMSRHISCLIVNDGKIVCIDHYVSIILDWKRSEKGGIIIGGCGMDMGFHLVYSLSSVLFRGDEVKPLDRAGYILEHSWI